MGQLTRRDVIVRALAALAALAAPVRIQARRLPLLSDVVIGNRGRPFAGDDAQLATISYAPDSRRTAAVVRFRLSRRATVQLDVLARGRTQYGERVSPLGGAPIDSWKVALGAGMRELAWRPEEGLDPRTYVLRLSTPNAVDEPSARVVTRLLGIDAGFAARSARPGAEADLVVCADARTLTVEMLHVGVEDGPTYANDVMPGVPITEPATIDWDSHRSRPYTLHVKIGDEWPSGLYAAKLESDDGRLGFAPIVVPPSTPRSRVAVVMPTFTWQAYNQYDANGDGWGDTWYARWSTKTIDLTRPHMHRGVPYRFRSYDLAFLHWLERESKVVDFYAEEDIERFGAAVLRRAYDLVVFPGHTEYVTARMYDVVSAYRDLGGRLLFLSANSFFRRVDRRGRWLTLIDTWRQLGRPEAALCGVQYLASDLGTNQQPFVVTGADAAPWAFEGTDLKNGSEFGKYGIEIDHRARSSPPSVQVLAQIPDLLGPGRTAEMTYYETPRGARVFSAGALNFGGEVLLWPETTQLLRNVWTRLTT